MIEPINTNDLRSMAIALLIPHCDLENISSTLEKVADEIDRLQSIVDKLPKTADGVPIVWGDRVWIWPMGYVIPREMIVWEISPDGRLNLSIGRFGSNQTYSTREAAEAAKEKR